MPQTAQHGNASGNTGGEANGNANVNIDVNIRIAVESVWFDDARSGNFDIALGVIISTLLDPSDYYNAWYRTDGPQNHSFWTNPKFDALLNQIRAIVGPQNVHTGPAELLTYSYDGNFPQRPPDAVVTPGSTEEVSRVLPGLRLVPGQRFRYLPNTSFRGPLSVRVRWDV